MDYGRLKGKKSITGISTEKKKSKLKRIRHTTGKLKDEANQSNQKRSKKGISKKDHDKKSKKDLARLTGKDATAGKNLDRMKTHLKRAEKEEQEVKLKLKKYYKSGITIIGSLSQRNYLFSIPPDELMLGDERILTYPELTMYPKDRIALTVSKKNFDELNQISEIKPEK